MKFPVGGSYHAVTAQILTVFLVFCASFSAQGGSVGNLHRARCAEVLASFESEAILEAQGFPPAWYEGMDEVREFLAAADFLRGPGIDSRKTHIPFLENQVVKILARVQADIAMQTEDREERDFLFGRFVEEFNERRETRTVTYRWANHFAYRLSIVAVPWQQRVSFRENRQSISAFQAHVLATDSWHTDARMEQASLRFLDNPQEETVGKVLDSFPHILMFPSARPFGIIPLARAATEKITDLAIISGTRNAHGITMLADQHAQHEILHAYELVRNIAAFEAWGQILSQDRFYEVRKKLLDEMAKLNRDDRLAAEFVYVFLIHDLEDAAGWKLLFTSSFWQDGDLHEILLQVIEHTTTSEVMTLVPEGQTLSHFARRGMSQLQRILAHIYMAEGI